MPKKKTGRESRSEQTYIPGTEPVKIPPVHRAIEEYVAARDRRMELTRVEVEKRGSLVAAMKKAGISEYAVDGHEANLAVEESVKARLRGDEPEE